jgi:hypothetical protein
MSQCQGMFRYKNLIIGRFRACAVHSGKQILTLVTMWLRTVKVTLRGIVRNCILELYSEREKNLFSAGFEPALASPTNGFRFC